MKKTTVKTKNNCKGNAYVSICTQKSPLILNGKSRKPKILVFSVFLNEWLKVLLILVVLGVDRKTTTADN